MMTEEAKKLRNEYMRKWREKKREKIKLYHELYWEKKPWKNQSRKIKPSVFIAAKNSLPSVPMQDTALRLAG